MNNQNQIHVLGALGQTGIGNLTISSSGSSLHNHNTSQNFSTVGSPWGYSSSGEDVKIELKQIKKFMDNVERRLAILEDPSPEKLERHAALRKAYEHYKTIERLIGDE